MSITPAIRDEVTRPRVRHQARDAVAVMAFSAACSLGLVLFLLLAVQLGR